MDLPPLIVNFQTSHDFEASLKASMKRWCLWVQPLVEKLDPRDAECLPELVCSFANLLAKSLEGCSAGDASVSIKLCYAQTKCILIKR